MLYYSSTLVLQVLLYSCARIRGGEGRCGGGHDSDEAKRRSKGTKKQVQAENKTGTTPFNQTRRHASRFWVRFCITHTLLDIKQVEISSVYQLNSIYIILGGCACFCFFSICLMIAPGASSVFFPVNNCCKRAIATERGPLEFRWRWRAELWGTIATAGGLRGKKHSLRNFYG